MTTLSRNTGLLLFPLFYYLEVFICGGQDGGGIFSDVWKINLKTLQWEKLNTNLPTPVYFHSAAISQAGQLFVFGGVNSILENSRTNELFSMWVKIPSLAEMCWEAILYYIPHIAWLKKENLFEAGVPVHFLNQIVFESSLEKEIKNCCYRLQS
ncbi:kelch domain-containing protein 10-like [Stegodyphus dumicola]|uniref:kelch domain-containing protein 10-like n=1 Tax=Stegodyphus dumicola TaxID=202533 RepID=UPI0015A7F800|nr:kelch domain-containing protein 10-like [Stegodyphus dumicola]